MKSKRIAQVLPALFCMRFQSRHWRTCHILELTRRGSLIQACSISTFTKGNRKKVVSDTLPGSSNTQSNSAVIIHLPPKPCDNPLLRCIRDLKKFSRMAMAETMGTFLLRYLEKPLIVDESNTKETPNILPCKKFNCKYQQLCYRIGTALTFSLLRPSTSTNDTDEWRWCNWINKVKSC